ncbi:MFS transporter [Nocardiopsis ganjiahuensis]|uniref:MFS transporter n=1 Tax=Nocardiopsis ganjiahuensis TaxID=239984 RepID=UPI00034C811D|nr:MFS transporter [Nocardiopsis ganjiahuensis]
MRLGPEFRRIWLGNASSNLADGITFVALPLLAATVTQDPLAVAGLSVAYTVPRVLAVLGIGVLVDRADRRRLLHLSNFSRAVVFGLLTLLVSLDMAPLTVLYLVFAVMGVVETVSDSSAFAVLPQAVRPQGLDRANSRIAGTQIVVDEFVGPPLGGFLFAAAALAPSAVSTLAFLAAGVAYYSLRGDYRQAGGPRENVLSEVREGAVWVWRDPVVRTLVVISALASVAYMIPFSYLVLYAGQVLGLGPTGYGLLLSASAVGGLAGAWIAGRLRARWGYHRSITGALLTGALAFAAIPLTDHVVVVAALLAVYIGHSVVWNVLAASVRQKAVPARLMGRAGSVSRLLGMSGLALGALLGGTLASLFGLRPPFLVAGALFLAAAVVCVLAAPGFREWEREQQAREATDEHG